VVSATSVPVEKSASSSAAAQGPKLRIENLSCRFGNIQALHDVNLSIEAGEFVCILGASGCGKSTLFNIVAGLQKATSGNIYLDGANINEKPGQVGYMLQKDLLLPWRTVLGNITLAAALTRGVRDADRKQARDLARKYGLGDFLNHYPHTLSGGMRQRVAMMRTVAAGRPILLLDEPFGALDAQTRLGMQQWVLEIWRDLGVTVLFVTHDVDEAIFLASRIVVMTPRPGRIAEILQVDLPRPRDFDSLTTPTFVELKRRIMGHLYGKDSSHA
jgi:ABC-type nitrate/sulfonate/bicarbonate transport system ATPase subunit